MSGDTDGLRMTGVGAVCVPVSDQDRAIDFYTRTLGFEVLMDMPYGEGERWVEVAPKSGGTSLALVPSGHGVGAGSPSRIIFDSPDVRADVEALRARGVEVDDSMVAGGGGAPPIVSFRDQDGNHHMIVQRNAVTGG